MIRRGFTTVELLVTIAILVIVFSLGASIFSLVQKTAAAASGSVALEQILGGAARRARSGEAGTNWGAYLPYDEITRRASTITVFSGSSYAARDVSRDVFYRFNQGVLFTAVDFSGAGSSLGNDHEVVFAPLSGETTDYGSVTINIYGGAFTIFVSQDGMVVLD